MHCILWILNKQSSLFFAHFYHKICLCSQDATNLYYKCIIIQFSQKNRTTNDCDLWMSDSIKHLKIFILKSNAPSIIIILQKERKFSIFFWFQLNNFLLLFRFVFNIGWKKEDEKKNLRNFIFPEVFLHCQQFLINFFNINYIFIAFFPPVHFHNCTVYTRLWSSTPCFFH